MNYGFYGSLMTVVMLVAFVGIVVWALGANRSAAFDAAARMPLEDDEEPGTRSVRDQA